MSLYPCELHKARVPGALDSIRITLLYDGDSYSRRLRLCSSHLDEVVSDAAKQWHSLGSDDDYAPNSVCSACGRDISGASARATGFAWVYKRNADPLELIGDLCGPDAGDLISKLKLEIQTKPS